MNLRRGVVVACVLMATSAAPARAQSAAGQMPALGSRVRLTLDGGEARVVGVLLDSAADTVRVTSPDGVVVSLPKATVRVLEVSAGRRRSWLKGAVIGASIGALLGLVTGTGNPGQPKNRGEALAQGVVGFGAWGAGIGAFVRGDRWVVVRF